MIAEGLDAGPLTLQWHLAQARDLAVPSTSTIRRILHHHGLITPQPRKRPRSSYHPLRRRATQRVLAIRFHPLGIWPMAPTPRSSTGSTTTPDTCCAATAYRRVAGPDVVASFTATATTYGLPASTLTDNGSVYTSRFTHGHNDFELLLASLGRHPEERPPRPSSNPRQNRTLPPNPQTLAHRRDPTRHHRRTTNPARHLRRHLQHPTPTPRPHPRATPPTGLPRPTQSHTPPANPARTSASATTPSTNSANSPCATAAAYTTSASVDTTPAPRY